MLSPTALLPLLHLLLLLLFIPQTLTSPTPQPLIPHGFTTLSTLSATVSKRADFSVVRNDLTSEPCQRLTVIFARGTTEIGNVGSVVGPPFFNALEAILGETNVAIQGVDYDADLGGYLQGGDPQGARDLVAKANLAASRCPATQIVLAGYSQGAQVVHLGAALLPASTAARVKAAVLFGDPKRGQPLRAISADKVVTYCFETDLICDGAPIVLPAHLSYSVYAIPAARFVVSKLS